MTEPHDLPRLAVPRPLNRQDAVAMPRMNRSATASDADDALVVRLRDGDESAFAELIDTYGATMLRVAQMFVRDRATAEEVVQETWLAVLNGIDRFEGRSSLKTWLFRILTNRAKTRGQRDGRTVPFSSLAGAGEEGEPAVDPDRFLGPDSPHPGAWAAPPRAWPHDRVLAAGDARRDPGGYRRAAGGAARGDPAARRGGLDADGGRRRPGDQRRQPAGAAPSGPIKGARPLWRCT